MADPFNPLPGATSENVRGEDIVLQEAVADSDFDVNEAISVHTSDWSK